MSDNPMLNRWWCPRHWEPYEADAAAGDRASVLISKRLSERRDFMSAVKHRQAAYHVGLARAIHAVVEDWVGRADKPICCLLGDTVMSHIHGAVYSPAPPSKPTTGALGDGVLRDSV